MSFYQLEDVLFGLMMGPDGYCVQALSRCEYKGTKSLTMDEEYRLMKKQVEETEGFDMDFSQFRYAFNYKPVDFDDNKLPILDDGETIRELLDRLSRKSLELYNIKETKTSSYGLFVEVSKANYHMAGAGVMFFITFLAKQDSSDNEPKTFQAKVHFSCVDHNKYLTCDLKPPPKNVHSNDTADKEDAKKPRLTQEKDASKH
ncbi:hypothetical protein Rs2_46319 [Raphanus sativus]|nr:hypothetical protein Rs2_46319 [Raphanus sativus]